MSFTVDQSNSTADAASSDSNLQGATSAVDPDRVHYLPRGRTRANLKTARGTMMESARLYRCWRTGRLDRASYLAAVRGLAEHRGHLAALREEEIITDIAARLAAIEQQPRAIAAPEAA